MTVEINGSMFVVELIFVDGVAVMEVTDQFAVCEPLTQLIKVPTTTGFVEQPTGFHNAEPPVTILAVLAAGKIVEQEESATF